MRRTRFRRRPKVVWLPTIGYSQVNQASTEGAPQEFFGDGRFNVLTIDPGGTLTNGRVVHTTEVITFDDTFSPTQLEYDSEYSGASLRDLVSGQEYRIRRLLGRMYCSFTAAAGITENPQLPAVEVGVGLMVRELGDGATAFIGSLNPLDGQATEDPWIWKKHWVLGSWPYYQVGGTASGVGPGDSYWKFPSSNAWYGSVTDGPQIDQKTARTVKRGQRLVMHLAARPISVGIAGSTEPADHNGGSVNFWWNMRVLASLRGSAYGNRGNASR